ncbi:MAG: type II toxin-antitoxin system RelE/ParE family toxin [Deltaproteobacteria bacterium]|nr:type II toxin-antitoxin system RelE/ParE family toxin [Deltaproteobacteria bacterium]
MRRRIALHPLAEEEASAAAAWYAERDPAVSAAFFDELDQALDRIAEAPRRWPRHLAGTRRPMLHRFPYAVIYREEPGRIFVIAVAHGHRRPGYWTGR